MNEWITSRWMNEDMRRVFGLSARVPESPHLGIGIRYIRQYDPAHDPPLRRTSPLLVPAFQPCPCCDHGWVLTHNDSGPYFRRCVCWQAHQRRVTAILSGKDG